MGTVMITFISRVQFGQSDRAPTDRCTPGAHWPLRHYLYQTGKDAHGPWALVQTLALASAAALLCPTTSLYVIPSPWESQQQHSLCFGPEIVLTCLEWVLP